VKKWLNENKVFFEIGSALTFGIASVIIAISANRVSQSQLEIAEIQLKPLIYISEKYLNDEAGMAVETILEINNAGAPVYEFSVDTRTFYTVSTNSETIWVPVSGYYYGQFELKAVDGKLAEVRGMNNNSVFAQLNLQHVHSKDDENFGYTELRRVTVTRVSYETRRNEDIEEYFVGEDGSDDPWVKEAFLSFYDHNWPIDINKADWPAVVNAALKIKKDTPIFVRNSGF
jgi:hypothetical protein